MTEQKYRPKANNQDTPLYPAEGRVDVASDVEEEQRNAYSAHHKQTSPQSSRTIQHQSTHVPSADPAHMEPPPVEGRVDVASDIEEEQRNAYSAHHH